MSASKEPPVPQTCYRKFSPPGRFFPSTHFGLFSIGELGLPELALTWRVNQRLYTHKLPVQISNQDKVKPSCVAGYKRRGGEADAFCRRGTIGSLGTSG